MYRNIKSKVKFNKTLSEDFSCYVGVGREEICLEIYLSVVREGTLKLLISLFISGLYFLQVVLLMSPIRHNLGNHFKQF